MDLLRFLLISPFALIKGLYRLSAYLLRLVGRLLRPVVGNPNWRAPQWMTKTANGLHCVFNRSEQWVAKHPKGISAAIVLLMAAASAAFYGYHWYLNRPQPIEPAPMVYQETSIRVSAPRTVNYQAQKPEAQPLSLNFMHSAAPITAMGQVIDQGISLTPAIEGEWKWATERTLVFTPKKPGRWALTTKLRSMQKNF